MLMIFVNSGYGNVVKYSVVEYDENLVKGWEDMGDGMWGNEDEVIVMGESEGECVEKLRKYDVEELGEVYEYVRI